mmetsp:Transcript_36394/g.66671  ORF Transcript_36394/g.66671 Transcript_36394/m.66671 type:complete len:144 (-) Transcript_36394:53-484(-)
MATPRMAVDVWRPCSLHLASSWFQARYLSLSATRLGSRRKSMSCWGTSRQNVPPLLPEGMDPRGRHHCGPSKYIGKTPSEIVSLFKVPSFPFYRLPDSVRAQRFEVLWQLAHKTGNKVALQAVRLLTEEAYDAKKSVTVARFS